MHSPRRAQRRAARSCGLAAPLLVLAVTLASACAIGETGVVPVGTSTSGGGGSGGSAGTTTSPTTTDASSSAPTIATTTGSGASGGGGSGLAGPDACETPPSGTVEAPVELEPNDTLATANALAAGTKGFTGALCPAGDADVFAAALAGGESISVAVTDGNGGCPAAVLPFVTILDAAGSTLAADTGFGCVSLTPKGIPALAGLPAGAYYIQVASSEPLPVAMYAVDIAVRPPGCDDGIVQIAEGEQCDDGNTSAGDGCSGACQLEGDFVGEAEVNDTQASAGPLDGAQGAVGALSPEGDADFYSFQVTAPGSAVSALVSDGLGGCPYAFEGEISLFGPDGVLRGSSSNGGVEQCPVLDPALVAGATGLPAGIYTLQVRSLAFVAHPSYVLTVDVHPPGCGDAVKSPGEQCDDGNSASGDGCSALCVVEPPWEVEPNDAKAKATPLWLGTSRWRAWLKPLGDRDWYSFTVAAGADVTLSTSAIGNAGACDFDSAIDLVSAAGVELASNDQGGVNACSKLSPTNDPALAGMAAGTYFVWVEEISESPLTPSYELRIDIQ